MKIYYLTSIEMFQMIFIQINLQNDTLARLWAVRNAHAKPWRTWRDMQHPPRARRVRMCEEFVAKTLTQIQILLHGKYSLCWIYGYVIGTSLPNSHKLRAIECFQNRERVR